MENGHILELVSNIMVAIVSMRTVNVFCVDKLQVCSEQLAY